MSTKGIGCVELIVKYFVQFKYNRKMTGVARVEYVSVSVVTVSFQRLVRVENINPARLVSKRRKYMCL